MMTKLPSNLVAQASLPTPLGPMTAAATDQGVARGDTVSLQMADGAKDFRIAAVFEPNAFISSPIVATPQTLLDAGYPDVDNFLIIETGGADLRVQQALEEVVADNPIVTVKDQAAFADEQRAPINQLLATVYALLGLAVFIAFLGIVNTLILSVIERTRELGLLRAIGLDRAATWRMITLESVVIAVLGALLGVAMGIGFGVSIVYALREDGLEVISLPIGQLSIFVVSSIVVGVIAAVIPAWRAARLDVLSAIATE